MATFELRFIEKSKIRISNTNRMFCFDFLDVEENISLYEFKNVWIWLLTLVEKMIFCFVLYKSFLRFLF